MVALQTIVHIKKQGEKKGKEGAKKGKEAGKREGKKGRKKGEEGMRAKQARCGKIGVLARKLRIDLGPGWVIFATLAVFFEGSWGKMAHSFSLS